MKRLLAVIAAVMIITAASGAFAASQKQTSASPHEGMGVKDADTGSALSGKVTETMDAGGYTYICIENAGKKTWLAVPQTQVIVGQQLSFSPGSVMSNFTSKSLGRTFDSIIFSGGIVSGGGAAAGHGGAAGDAGMKTGGSKAAAVAQEKDIKVEKATGANAYTVSEVYEKRAALNGKTASVQAKVVKVNADVMNRNWIHLQDGTGDAKKGTHDLVATSKDLPKVGDVVTAKGKIVKDKDFGSGYKFVVIMEETKIQK